MSTCSTCRYFGPAKPLVIQHWTEPPAPADYTESRSEHHVCARIIHAPGASSDASSMDEPAVVSDGSGYAAALRVLPTFGCVLHEPGAGAWRRTTEDLESLGHRLLDDPERG